MKDSKLTSLSDEQRAQVTGGFVPDIQNCPACGADDFGAVGYSVRYLVTGCQS